MIGTLIGMVAGAAANIWGGYEHGDRYTAGLAIAVILCLLAPLNIALAVGVGFILWRLVGWRARLLQAVVIWSSGVPRRLCKRFS